MRDGVDYLFVYGTLRRNSKNKFATLLHSRAQLAGNARMPGRLYRLGRYPGAVATGVDGEWIRGELYRIDDRQWLLPALDRYEGSQFRRANMAVRMDAGDQVLAWVYLYRGTPAGALIRSGDWLRR